MTARSLPSAKALLACAHELADASGATIRPYFRKTIAVHDKGGMAGFDPVTAADRAAEKVIIRHLRAAFPDHGIEGEEFGIANASARYRWVIDPIDGTRAFIAGLPTWGTLIGLLEGGDAVLGLMDQPITQERFWSAPTGAYARTGGGRARRIATRRCADLEQAVLSTTHPDLFACGRPQAVHAAFKARARLTRYGADCYAFCMLAAGFIDVVIESGLKPYDIVALIPIIEKAGGRVTTWDGGPATGGGDVLATGDPRLHAALLKMIAGIPG